jgi:uncharacterized protein with HEPN domain
MPSRNAAQRLRDIVENIDAVRGFVEGMDLARFSQDRKTIYAVVRALEIISEASRRLPDELKHRNAELDWSRLPRRGTFIVTSMRRWTPQSPGILCIGSWRRFAKSWLPSWHASK